MDFQNAFLDFPTALLPPSVTNSQHWRFKVSPGFKSISIAMPVFYRHIKWEHPDVDIGICAYHFWLGVVLKNLDCRVLLREEEGRAVWQFLTIVHLLHSEASTRLAKLKEEVRMLEITCTIPVDVL